MPESLLPIPPPVVAYGSGRRLSVFCFPVAAGAVCLRWDPPEHEWPGWIWCTTEGGESRWVPENWVEKECDHCVLLREYTATELNVGEGETVTVESVESGWGWATGESGESGWVPVECVETGT